MWVRLGERMYVDENMPLPSQSECSQMETESLSAVVVAERLRVGLENLFDQALSESEDEIGTFVGNLANEMLNQSSLGLDQPVKELLMEI
ncbi:unnamed protein product [Hymenolepis diminuta]|nr:unnamed protein product [Hymenolepis diminuta]